jgi:hypothetical protein
MAGKDDIEEKVAALGDLSRDQLVALWRKTFGVDAPRGVHKGLLIRAAAFHLQQKHYGGLSSEAKRQLKIAIRDLRRSLATKTASGASAERPVSASPAKAAVSKERRSIQPGARLIRDWNGKSHVVDVVERGFLYGGNRYRSLSKIAREITGTSWSGPRFFGL